MSRVQRNGSSTLRASIAVLIISVTLAGCTRHPTKAECVDGDYTLRNAAELHLIISANSYSLRFRGDAVTGAFHFDPVASVYEFAQGRGRLSDESKRALSQMLHQQAARVSDLDGLQEGSKGDAFASHQDDNGGIVIEVDYDTNSYFSKPTCRSTG